MREFGRYHEVRLPGRLDPLHLAARLARSGLFEEHVVYERDGCWWFAGGALGAVVADPRSCRLRWGGRQEVHPWRPDLVGAVSAALASLPFHGWRAFGWAAFEAAYAVQGASHLLRDVDTLFHLTVPHTEVAISADGAIIRSVSTTTILLVRELLTDPLDISTDSVVSVPVDTTDVREYQDAVAGAVADVGQGRFQKVVLSRRIPVGFPVDYVGTYVRGRLQNTPARSFLLHSGGRRAAGFSPETVVEVLGEGEVRTQPLAGTRAFGTGTDGDARLRTELLADPKEIHEHAVSVKISYDELRTVCDPTSVAVREFMAVKERGTVQHLGSTVAGRLQEGRGCWDAFAALFPAVTASGIPKRAAYECIARHEDGPRDLYGGAVMMVGDDGQMDAALVLRTVYEDHGAWLRAGAGIVRDSTPAREYEETCEKLRSVAEHVVPLAGALLDPLPAQRGGQLAYAAAAGPVVGR